MGISWQDIEVENMPRVTSTSLSGAALARAGELGANLWHLSLSHEKDSALAFVILENA
jgi:phosphopantetheinyl transferase (holo-ACP synthase)